jgi:hypothetical protein
MSPLKLYFEQDKVMLIYEYIDRKDKRGVHKETYIYTSGNTIELKKDLIINRICISGYPEYFSEYKNKKFNERITDEQIDFLLVMPDGGLRQQIIDGLQNSLKREIMEG